MPVISRRDFLERAELLSDAMAKKWISGLKLLPPSERDPGGEGFYNERLLQVVSLVRDLRELGEKLDTDIRQRFTDIDHNLLAAFLDDVGYLDESRWQAPCSLARPYRARFLFELYALEASMWTTDPENGGHKQKRISRPGVRAIHVERFKRLEGFSFDIFKSVTNGGLSAEQIFQWPAMFVNQPQHPLYDVSRAYLGLSKSDIYTFEQLVALVPRGESIDLFQRFQAFKSILVYEQMCQASDAADSLGKLKTGHQDSEGLKFSETKQRFKKRVFTTLNQRHQIGPNENIGYYEITYKAAPGLERKFIPPARPAFDPTAPRTTAGQFTTMAGNAAYLDSRHRIEELISVNMSNLTDEAISEDGRQKLLRDVHLRSPNPH
jgi:hypothetical protein